MRRYPENGSVPATGLVPTTITGANGEKYRDAVGDVVSYNAEEAKKAFEQGLQETGLKAEDLHLSILCDDQTSGQRTLSSSRHSGKRFWALT